MKTRNKEALCGLMSGLLLLAAGTRQAYCADVVDDFANGLTGWIVQSTQQNLPVANEVIAKPNGDPVIEIAASPDEVYDGMNNPPWTILTSSAVGAVGNFDISVSFAGSSGMDGGTSYGLVFGYQNPQNYYIANVFPGFAGSAFRVDKVTAGVTAVLWGSVLDNHDIGFTWNTGDDNTTTLPDAMRIRRTGNVFELLVANGSADGWQTNFDLGSGTGNNTWIDDTFPAGSTLVGFGERFNVLGAHVPGARFAMFGSGTRGASVVLASTDVPLSQSIKPADFFAVDGIIWLPPLARNGMSRDTDPSAGGTLKYRFKLGSNIPVKIAILGYYGYDVTLSDIVVGKIEVFGDTDMDGIADSGPLPIIYNGVGKPGGVMVKTDGQLQYNLDTKKLPTKYKCFILQVSATDKTTGETITEKLSLQPK